MPCSRVIPRAGTVWTHKKKDLRFEAGVYRNGPGLIAVNRPAAEDSLEVIEKAAAKQLFGGLPLQFFEEHGGDASPLQGEIWRPLFIAMLLALLAEGVLSLPLQATASAQKSPVAARAAFVESASP